MPTSRGNKKHPRRLPDVSLSAIFSPILTRDYEPEEEKKRELARELKRINERLIATAIESAMGCRLENRVLYLQYPHPSVNDFILKDSRRKPT